MSFGIFFTSFAVFYANYIVLRVGIPIVFVAIKTGYLLARGAVYSKSESPFKYWLGIIFWISVAFILSFASVVCASGLFALLN